MVNVDFVKDLMSQDYPDCPYDFVLGKEFLPDFALEGNKRLSRMRAFQKCYLRVTQLSLQVVPVCYPAHNIFNISVEFLKLTISFEDTQFLFRHKRLEVSRITLWCM